MNEGIGQVHVARFLPLGRRKERQRPATAAQSEGQTSLDFAGTCAQCGNARQPLPKRG